jgi:ABC-type lipoprotein export system ATPase subunit
LNGEGTTIIQVTHSEKYASYGKRIIKLSDGWMDGEITPEQLLGRVS